MNRENPEGLGEPLYNSQFNDIDLFKLFVVVLKRESV